MNTSHDTAPVGTTHPSGGLIIGDGAMGTELARLGSRAETALHANASEGELVRRVHRDYLGAGARVIQANAFLAPHLLAIAPDDTTRSAIVDHARRGVQHAVDIVNEQPAPHRPDVWLSLGPVAPDTLPEVIAATYSALAAHAASTAGMSTIMLETFFSESSLLDAASAALDGCDSQANATAAPALVLSLTMPQPDVGAAWSTAAPERLSQQPFAGRVRAVGLNCGPGWDAATWIALADDLHARLPANLGLLIKPPRPANDDSPAAATLDPLVAHLRALSDDRHIYLMGCCGLGPEAIIRWHRQPNA